MMDGPSFRSSGPAHQVHASLRAAPLCSLDELTGAGNILIVAPHPDDETLGCGGLIAACVRSNRSVLIDILTDGSRSHPGSRAYPPGRLADLRKSEALAAAAMLGLEPSAVRFHDQPDGFLASQSDAAESLVDRLSARIEAAGISAVFVTCVADPHPDHRQAFAVTERAVARCARRPRLFAYPIWLWSEAGSISLGDRAVAAYRLDITSDLPRKRRAIDCYGSQLGRVVTDAPDGFRLTEQALARFTQPHEYFVAFAA